MDRKRATALNKEASALFKQGHFKLAMTTYQNALKVCGDSKKVNCQNFVVSFQPFKKYEQSARYAKKCIELDPNFQKALSLLIRSFIAESDFKEAETWVLRLDNLAIRNEFFQEIQQKRTKERELRSKPPTETNDEQKRIHCRHFRKMFDF